MIIINVFADQVTKVVLAKDEKEREALFLDRLDPTFGDGVHVGPPGPDTYWFYVLALKNLSPRLGKLRIGIMNDIARKDVQIIEKEDQVARLLLHPEFVGIGCHARDMDLSCADLDEEENVVVDPTTKRQNFLRKEIARPKRLPMAADEFRPRAVARRGIDGKVVLSKDAVDRRSPDFESKIVELTLDPAGAPAFSLGHMNDQFANFVGNSVALRFFFRFVIGLFHHLLAVFTFILNPSEEGSRRDDADQFLDLRAKRHAKFNECRSLSLGCIDLLGQSRAKDPILGLQILDVPPEFGIGRAGDHCQQWMDKLPQRRSHRCISRVIVTIGWVSSAGTPLKTLVTKVYPRNSHEAWNVRTPYASGREVAPRTAI